MMEATTTATMPASPIEVLCDNTLAHILSFLDFSSVVSVSKLTSKALTRRIFHPDANPRHLFQQIFERHLFAAPLAVAAKDIDYLQECQERRRIFSNLMGRRRQRRHKIKSCFNLPDRYFYFVPVTPQHDDDEDDDDYVPPVDFDCPSFLLTHAGTDGEMLFLDPFDGSLVLYSSCLDNAVASDEAMMEQAMMDAAVMITHAQCSSSSSDGVVKDEHIAGAVIEDSVFRNHNMQQYQQDPHVVLMNLEDYFNIQLSEYFRLSEGSRRSHFGRRNDHDVLYEDDEVEIDLVGIDAKPILGSDDDSKVLGTMVAVGRTLCTDPEEEAWRDTKLCSELMVWKRLTNNSNRRMVCRVRSPYKTMELDPAFERVYFSFPFQEGPFRRFDVNGEDTDHVDFEGGSRVVAAYPMQDYPEVVDHDRQHDHAGPKHFCKPDFVLMCHHPVSSLAVAPDGKTVLTATTKGTIEFWTTGRAGATRTSVLDIEAALKQPAVTATTTSTATQPQTPEDERMVEDDDDDNNADLSPISPVVTSFHFPLHFATLRKCGFVTLHHVQGQGSWLVLWKFEKEQYVVSCTITLPLSSRRKPCIHYDGRRLIVCGQDHIGMILLVYQVLNSWEDLDAFHQDVDFTKKGSGDESGGVVHHHHGDDTRVKFRNRIRHAALGGMEYYDPVYMTVNERFIIVNTKTGNLLGPTPGTDGLLVIDLEDYT